MPKELTKVKPQVSLSKNQDFFCKLFSCNSERSGAIPTDLTPKQRVSRPISVRVYYKHAVMKSWNLLGPFKRSSLVSQRIPTALWSPCAVAPWSMPLQRYYLIASKSMPFRMPKSFSSPLSQWLLSYGWANMKAESELVKQCSSYMFTTTGLGMEGEPFEVCW